MTWQLSQDYNGKFEQIKAVLDGNRAITQCLQQ